MNNINDYNITQCQEYCKQLSFYQEIEREFDIIRWDKLWIHSLWKDRPEMTPREFYGTRLDHLDPAQTVFSMVPFFYLRKLLEKNPETIYDLGSGWNIFKKYIPNIIGISPTNETDNYSDIHDIIDAEFISNHQDYFESIFSICALNFRPLTDLKLVVQEFASMIAPGGRGFLALNIMRMIEHTPRVLIEKEFGKVAPSKREYSEYTQKVLSDINLNYLIIDVDLTVPDEYMDGNIRIVIEK
jgi:hypothetical protein